MTNKRWMVIGCVVGFFGGAWQARGTMQPPAADTATVENRTDSIVQIQLQDGFHRPLPGETSLQLPAQATRVPDEAALRQAMMDTYLVRQGDVLALLNVPKKPGEYVALLGREVLKVDSPFFTMRLFWVHGRYDKKRWIQLQSQEISDWERREAWSAEHAKWDAARDERDAPKIPPLPLQSLQAVVDARVGFLDLDGDGTAELVLRLRYPTSNVSDRTVGEVYSFPGLERRLSLLLQVRRQLDKNPVVEEAVLRREVQPASMLLRVLSYQSDACKAAPCPASVSDGWVRYAWGGPAAVRAIRLPRSSLDEILGWNVPAVDVTASIGRAGAVKPNPDRSRYTYASSEGEPENKPPPLPDLTWVQQAAGPSAVFRLFSARDAGFRPVDFVRRREPPVEKSPTRRKRRISGDAMARESIKIHDAYDLLVPLAPQDLRLRELVVYQTVESSEWTWSREGRELSLPIPAGWQVVPEDLSGVTVRDIAMELLWISVPLRQANSSARSTHVYVVDAQAYRLLWQRRLWLEPNASGPACSARAFRMDIAQSGRQLFEWEEACGNQRQSAWWTQENKHAPFREVPRPTFEPVPLKELEADRIWPGENL